MFHWLRSRYRQWQVQHLIGRLPFSDETVAAMNRLGELGDPRAIEALKGYTRLIPSFSYAAGLHHRNLIEAAVSALVKLGAAEILPILIDNLVIAQSPGQKEACRETLKTFGWRRPENPEQNVALAIFSGQCATAAVHGDIAKPLLRRALAARLAGSDTSAIELKYEIRYDVDEQWAPLARTLAQFGDRADADAFIEGLMSCDPGIRKAAAALIRTINPKSKLGQSLPERRALKIEASLKRIAKQSGEIQELNSLLRLGAEGLDAARRAVQDMKREQKEKLVAARLLTGWAEIQFLLGDLPPKPQLGPATVLPHFACGYCHVEVVFRHDASAAIKCEKCGSKLKLRAYVKCPKCGGAPELKEDLAGGTAAAIVGGILLGGVGAMIGKAAGGTMTTKYCCQKCNHRWGIELLEQADY